MSRFHWLMVGIVAGAICLIAVAGYWRQQVDRRPIQAKIIEPPQRPSRSPPKERPVPEGFVEVGGVIRPKTDVEKPPPKNWNPDTPKSNIGVVPQVPKETNASTRSVAEAINNPQELAHRLSILHSPPDFDLEKYHADPQAYLDTVEPGRINQYLPDGTEGATRLGRRSAFYQEALRGEKVILLAKANASAPVTFYSNRLGQFQNSLITVTVAADEEGVARAELLISGGARDEIEVFAASPVHIGQVRFLVKIRESL